MGSISSLAYERTWFPYPIVFSGSYFLVISSISLFKKLGNIEVDTLFESKTVLFILYLVRDLAL